MTLTLTNAAKGISLALLALEDAEELLQLRIRNREAHQPFEPKREEDFFTLATQQQLISQRIADADQDRAYMFGVYNLDNKLIGQVTLSNVVRGVAQYADIGYFMDQAEQGKGYMSAAVGLVLKYAFRALDLHRVQAGILLHNEGSRRVLENNGFQAEGVSRKYLKINGEFQDHQIYSILIDEYQEH